MPGSVAVSDCAVRGGDEESSRLDSGLSTFVIVPAWMTRGTNMGASAFITVSDEACEDFESTTIGTGR